MGKKILITGGLGFVGSYLAKRLISLDYDVTVLDNLYRGNTERLDEQDNLRVIDGDINNDALVKELIEQNDVIFHLAAISQVMTSIENPDLTFEYNIVGTESIAKYCTKFNRKLIFSSSREVYGSADHLPVDEEHSLKPENPYASSKISGEAVIKAYSSAYGLKYVILRLSNVYGNGDTGRVIPIFIEKAMNLEDITIFGDKKIVDFVYIEDVIDAFLISLNYDRNDTFNIGTGTSTTLPELAECVIDMTDSRSKYTIVRPRNGEVDKFTADISKIRRELGWIPKYKLKDGLSEMIS